MQCRFLNNRTSWPQGPSSAVVNMVSFLLVENCFKHKQGNHMLTSALAAAMPLKP